MSVWVKTTNSTGLDSWDAYYGGMVFSAYNTHTLTNDTIPISLTGGKVAFFTRDGAGNSTTLRSTRSVNDGSYHLITVTREQASGLKGFCGRSWIWCACRGRTGGRQAYGCPVRVRRRIM